MSWKHSGISKHWRAATVLVTVGLVAAACGGSSKPKAAGTTTSTSSVEATTTTSALTSETTVAGATTSTTAAAAVTTTTKKPTTATTRKSVATGASGGKGVTQVQGGLTNVTAAPTTVPAANIQAGGTITWLKAGEVAGLDPLVDNNSGASDGPMAMAVFDMLAYSDGGQIKPQTLDSLTSSDGVVWTMKLKPNIKFSDGTPYDATAVKFNYARLADPAKHAVRAVLAQQINTMDVIDAQTLKVTLKSKNALFPGAVALIPFIGSPAAIQSLGDDKFNNAPIGAGPYILKSWTHDSQMVFTRNPTYWQAPRPYVDQIIFKPIVDEGQRISTFCAGGANMTYIGSVLNADQTNKQGCGTIQPLVLNGGTDLMMNVKTKPFNDIRLRQAVAMAFNMDDYSKIVDAGLIAPTHGIFRTDSPFYDPTILQPAYDPVKAQQLFDQVAADNGGTISWSLTTFSTPSYLTPATYFQGLFNKYNHVHVDLNVEASAVHITNATTSSFQMSAFGNIFDDPEPTWTALYLCGANPNYTGYCDPKFDALIADNQTTLDPAKRIQDIKDAQKLFYAATPTWFFETRYSWVFTAPNVNDFHFVNDGLPLLDRFWIKSHS